MDNKDVANYWDKNAPEYAKAVRSKHDFFREYVNNPAFFRLLGNIQDLYILDVGCGEGLTTRMLVDRGAKATGIDLSEKMIEAALQHESNEPRGIEYFIASGNDLSQFRDATFDVVVSTMAMMDMADYAGCVKEVCRVLKPKGFFQFSITHPCFFTRTWQWITDEQGNQKGIVAGDYFSFHAKPGETQVVEWFFAGTSSEERTQGRPIQVPSFFRTLSEYLNVLTKAGFVVKHLDEPFASEEDVKKCPRINNARIVPHFLIFRCQK